eukprot:CAMPEP_0195517232 /NCGR_PEP_ID=MMETSP0794_2-20130614/10252_1 /TAXON_ID=515487 /ORGANISM="Stephanopyxis turris, Strain CCMP 815" /LENGTH=137 /DNA_ID=CAMNT_0040646005 /DNA_START=27 /DNA_END=440 /DNA_ORIENTATION=-
MGRRAKKAPVQTKKKITLAKRFKCPFCANDDVVECKMDHKNGVGSLKCRLCQVDYQMPIHHLHEPIDVFSEWLDDCETAERANNGTGPVGGSYDEDDALDGPSGLHSSSGGGAQKSNGPKQTITSLGLDDDSDSDGE